MTLTLSFDKDIAEEVIDAICQAARQRPQPNQPKAPETAEEKKAFAENYLRTHALAVARQQAVRKAQAEAAARLR